jgi:hypothetical protein
MRVACKKFQSEKKKSTINNKFSVAFISVVLNCSLQSQVQWQYKGFCGLSHRNFNCIGRIFPQYKGFQHNHNLKPWFPV